MKRWYVVLVGMAALTLCGTVAMACNDYGCGGGGWLKPPELKSLIKQACDLPGCGDWQNDPTVRDVLKLACDYPGCGGGYLKPQDLDELLKLACDYPGCDGWHHEKKKLQELACNTPSCGEGWLKPPDLFKGLMQLACSWDGCDGGWLVDPDTQKLSRTQTAKADSKGLKFMGVRKSINPADLEASVAKKTDQTLAQAMDRIRDADPKDFPVFTAFLKKRVPVNAKDSHGNTLLFYVAAQGNARAVAWLLKKGADPKCKNDAGCTALDCAKTQETKKLLKAVN
ncbi:ankyrin repeat domain-containing protein [Thermodesulfobacteriota bacterium]